MSINAGAVPDHWTQNLINDRDDMTKVDAAALTFDRVRAQLKARLGTEVYSSWFQRMKLAEGKPLPRRLFAAMAQQDCGQCGYLCESYSKAIADGAETKLNLCAPGGKETSRMLKRLLEETPAAKGADKDPAREPGPAAPATPQPAGDAATGTRDAPREAIFRSASRLNGAGSQKDTHHVVFDISGSGLSYAPGDSFGLFPRNDPALADAVIAALSAPPDFPVGGKPLRDALIEDYALGLAPDMLFELMGYLVGGERRRKAKALARGEDPDQDAATLDVLATLETFAPVHPDPEAFLECLEPLQPRLYSIASCPLSAPGELHLTVDAVRYTVRGRLRHGVASTCLADRLAPGAAVKAYIQKAHAFDMRLARAGFRADRSRSSSPICGGCRMSSARCSFTSRRNASGSRRAASLSRCNWRMAGMMVLCCSGVSCGIGKPNFSTRRRCRRMT